MSAAVENLLAQLGSSRRSSSGWVAKCPAHEDRVASLSVREGRDGRVLVKCHAGCSVDAVVAKLGLTVVDLFEREPQRAGDGVSCSAGRASQTGSQRLTTPPVAGAAGRLPLRVTEADVERYREAVLGNDVVLRRLSEFRGWTREALERLEVGFDGKRVTLPYRDAQGRLVGLGRYHPNRETRGDGRKLKADAGSRRELFGGARETHDPAETVWLVEGEPDTIRAHSLGLAAVGVPGVEGWRSEHAARFAGRRVVVCFDCDAPGRQAAERVADELAPVVDEVRVLDLDPSRDDGFDFSDFTESARTADEREAMRRLLLDSAERAPRVEPPKPGDIAAALDAAEGLLRRYVALSEAQFVAVALWVAHAHALDAASTTPYLHVTSAEAESGKSRLMECLEVLVPKPMYAASMTPAVLYRAVEKLRPTLLVDEADNLLRDKEAKSELLGLLNAGYRRGALAYRMGGGNRDELQSFETFSAKAIAGLDGLVATLASRCLRVEMQRRRTDEHVEDFFREDVHSEAEPIRDGLAAWAEQNIETLRATKPARLGVRDRLEEACRLLLAIAEAAGERWESRARDALRELAGVSVGGAMSERTQLLSDIRDVFAAAGNRDELTTAELLDGLLGLDESPWRGWWGVERDGGIHPSKGAARKLSSHLRSFRIASRDIGPKDNRRKGYRRADFADVWARYLASAPVPLNANPRNPRKPHEQAESEGCESAHNGPGCADLGDAQTRMVEPDARIARIAPRPRESEDGPSVALDDSLPDALDAEGEAA